MKIVIGGGSGFIGRALAKSYAEDGHQVVALVRGDADVPGAKTVPWDGVNLEGWVDEFDGADIVVNLAGAPITLKWTDENRQLIRESRVHSTAAFRKAIDRVPVPPRVWLNGSAVGYYGDTGDREVDEASAPGVGFLPGVCLNWEREAFSEKCRVVFLRTGIVLGNGGMFRALSKLTKAFIGGPVGPGNQYVSWIHIDDYVRLLRWCGLGNLSGPVNLCAPRAATNRELMQTLRHVMGRPWAPPAPALAVKALGFFGGPDPSLVLMSARVVPRVALAKGFTFRFSELDNALNDLTRPHS